MIWYHVVPINIVYFYLPNNFALLYYSTTRGTFSKNVQRGTIFLLRMKLTWHDTMWCPSILYTFTYPTILHWSITLPQEGLLGKIIFKYPLISTLPFILQAEGILLNIFHIINVYLGPILQEINVYIAMHVYIPEWYNCCVKQFSTSSYLECSSRYKKEKKMELFNEFGEQPECIKDLSSYTEYSKLAIAALNCNTFLNY